MITDWHPADIPERYNPHRIYRIETRRKWQEEDAAAVSEQEAMGGRMWPRPKWIYRIVRIEGDRVEWTGTAKPKLQGERECLERLKEFSDYQKAMNR